MNSKILYTVFLACVFGVGCNHKMEKRQASGMFETREVVVSSEISGRVDELGNAIAESNGKMHEMVASMNEINEASREIDKIIATINQIASCSGCE